MHFLKEEITQHMFLFLDVLLHLVSPDDSLQPLISFCIETWKLLQSSEPRKGVEKVRSSKCSLVRQHGTVFMIFCFCQPQLSWGRKSHEADRRREREGKFSTARGGKARQHSRMTKSPSWLHRPLRVFSRRKIKSANEWFDFSTPRRGLTFSDL